MVATVVVMPFLLSMLLGRTIDLKSYDIGANIYDNTQYTEKSIGHLNSTYHVVDEDFVPYEKFGMPIDIVLRIKANYLSTSSGSLGLDGLLKDSSWMHNSVVVAVHTIYTSVERTLPKDAELLSGWQDRTPTSHTHYASSMTYGGWFFVLYRFKCDIPSDVQHVRKSVLSILGTSGQMGSDAPGLWKRVRDKVMANSDVRGIVRVEDHVYSSTDLPSELDSIFKVVKAIQDFPKVILGVGSPLYMTLKPLSEVDNRFSVVSRDQAKVNDLKVVDRMFDDLRNTRGRIIRWFQESDTINEDEEERISDLLGKITECLRIFYLMISDQSLYKEGGNSDIQNAISTYKRGLKNSDDTYYVEYLRLKEDIDASCVKKFLHGIKGLLKVYKGEEHYLGDIGAGGIDKCQSACTKDPRCRSIGYGDSIVQLEVSSGNYVTKKHQCWLYHRSTSTATVHTPNGLSGDVRVYDRLCL